MQDSCLISREIQSIRE